jgi:hypothetical protein
MLRLLRFGGCTALAGLLWAAAAPVLATEASPVEGVSLTVYNDNLSLIREQRTFVLAPGQQTLVLTDVSGQLQPQTVHLAMPQGPELDLLEQNFDYDLVDQNKLLSKFIGQEIALVNDANNSAIFGTLLSVNGGVIVKSGDHLLLNPPGRIVLPASAADGLLLRPTLSWLVDSPSGGTHQAEISYLSGGLDWNADYVLMLNPDDSAGDLEGWVTLNNNSGTTYTNADLKLVAGEVNRVRPQGGAGGARLDSQYQRGRTKTKDGFQEQSLFEYHLYELGRQTTIKNNQQKQIGLLTANGFPLKKRFLFDGNNGGDVHVSVEFKNEAEHGLGLPLPAGTVRVFKQDQSGQSQFVGEDRIEHTPRKDEVRLYIGNAFDIKGETTRTDYKDLRKGYSEAYKVHLKNRKLTEDAVITVEHSIGGDWTVTSSSLPYSKKDADTIQFEVPVKADSEVELTYAYKVEWK